MFGLAGRFHPLNVIGSLFGAPLPGTTTEETRRTHRIAQYARYDSYYGNWVYETAARGGYREKINEVLGNASSADLAGLFNPVARCVDLYQHALGGQFGVDILAKSPNSMLESGSPDDRATAKRRVTPLDQIWRWSNADQKKQVFCRLLPLHGNCGLRVVTKRGARPADARIYLKAEHPEIIRDVDLDDRGNVKWIELQYKYDFRRNGKLESITIREVMDQEVTRTYRVEGEQLTPFDMFSNVDNGDWTEIPNVLGVVPYVLAAHTPTGEAWSPNAFYRALGPIDRINALNAHLNTQIIKHVRVTTVVAASGTSPEEFDFSGNKVIYINTENATSQPTIEHLIANLNIGETINQIAKLNEQVEDMLPELKATGGHYLSGQSGETIAELRKPAEDLLSLARVNYEWAWVKACQIALSEGIVEGLWDLGTGAGTREAADDAYRSGALDFVFNDRPLFGDGLAARLESQSAAAPAMPTQPVNVGQSVPQEAP